MKKEIYLALGLSVAGAINANFPIKEATSQVIAQKQEDERIQIKADELPEAVKKTLTEDKYNAWEIYNVYRVKSSIEYYEVILKKETEIKTFKFDPNGRPIEEIK